jgi:hypothetical protein
MMIMKYEVKKFNSKNNLSFWQRIMKNLLIHQEVYKVLSEKEKKPIITWMMISEKR